MGVRVRLLGPVDVLMDDMPQRLNGSKRQALLAGLALSAGRVVGGTRLTELIWQGTPPPAAANALQRHVSHLRKVFGAGAAIVARPPGYQLDLGAGTTDVHVAERLLGAAAAASGPEQRLAHLRTAAGLWCGPALAGLRDRPWFDEQARRLDELLLRVRLELADARLAVGEGPRLVAELESLTRAHPWHEDIAALLIRALCSAGRQSDALAVHQRVRRSLREELGIEPGPRLRELEIAVLRQDPALAGPVLSGPAQPPAPAGPAQPPAPAGPAQLPAPVAAFTGREAELAALDRLAAETQIVAIAGTAGVGKTALAVRWSRRIAGRFPGGGLYVNLRGYDPDQPVPPAEALAGFLRALGVAGPDVPLGLDERAGCYRTALAGRRVLIVLDNAGSADQVRPLLPGAPGCLVVVTSRDSLAGLVALDGARRLDLGLLPAADALTLLRRLVGARVDAEPERAAELADQCARLPLALRVAAELAVTRPEVSLAGLARALADQRHRLELLDAGGEVRAAVASVFSWSFQQLPADVAHAFAAAGLHPGPDFEAGAVAALIGGDAGHAARLCARLARAHLVEAHGPGRYTMHDLLRAYARTRAALTPAEAAAAMTRLLDHYLAGAAAAMDVLHSAERAKRPRIEPVATTPRFTGPGDARAWLDAELPDLVAACAYAAAHGRAAHATALAQTLFRHLDMSGHHAEALTVHEHARRAARDSGDRSAEARALNNLAAAHWWRAEYARAAAYYRDAAVLFRAAGDRIGEADALCNLGLIARTTGVVADAAGHYAEALRLYRENGHALGEVSALKGLGVVHTLTGRLDEAAGHLGVALRLARAAGKVDGEADILTDLAGVQLRRGELEPAAATLGRALTLYRNLGYPGNEATTLNLLGAVARAAGDLAGALAYHESSLELRRATGTRNGEAAALNDFGGTLLATGAGPAAADRHAEALAVAAADGDRYQQARAHDGLAAAHRAAGDDAAARGHWEQALRLFAALGTAESDAVRSRLRELPRAA
ncbi:AfsR/SARP family transcriptional regulator [Symbioplanes lichenis]|uniref:AfsR/SARP family transcriptional regulator n=1 Tax=Symbioplanes lichenis TaxID=1629072 RepID=UPI00273A2C14|nr:BTAD domain-containing putative transcriptional regulator [Actinoplanes lichenis]